MNTLRNLFICCLAVLFLSAFKEYKRSIMPISNVIALPIKTVMPLDIDHLEIPELEIKPTSHQQFLDAIGHRESSNRYDVVNSYGYMGKYQFGKSTLKGLGFKVTKEEFLNNPELQEKAMYELLKHNQKKLRRFIEKYDGKVVHGVLITESGILAAAHLAGQGNVRKFFRKGYEFKDGYGTKMTSYMTQFGGYDLML
tara:strand:+ start:1155 stop:1745 length:591 start_codon:yes stop_codon:yes gene_type:complete